jgi:hypothetical protein
MIKVVQIRLVAETQADAQTAIATLRETVGSSRVALSSPSQGRKGGWLAYGTLQVDTSPPPSSPVTGPTTRLGE